MSQALWAWERAIRELKTEPKGTFVEHRPDSGALILWTPKAMESQERIDGVVQRLRLATLLTPRRS